MKYIHHTYLPYGPLKHEFIRKYLYTNIHIHYYFKCLGILQNCKINIHICSMYKTN